MSSGFHPVGGGGVGGSFPPPPPPPKKKKKRKRERRKEEKEREREVHGGEGERVYFCVTLQVISSLLLHDSII